MKRFLRWPPWWSWRVSVRLYLFCWFLWLLTLAYLLRYEVFG